MHQHRAARHGGAMTHAPATPLSRSTTTARLLTRASWLAAALVAAMFGLYVATGVGQDPLQYVHPSAAYDALLRASPATLRLTIGLDNLFVVAYTIVFAALCIRFRAVGAHRQLTLLAGALLGATALLDIVENVHFLTMISAAEQGLRIGDGEIRSQVVESMIKFHCSYLGLVLFGLLLPPVSKLARALKATLIWVQLPVGVAIYVVPASIAVPLVFVRFTFFVGALLALGGLGEATLDGPQRESATDAPP